MDLIEIRKEINAVDEGLVALFCERMRLCAEVAAYKKENGMPVFDPEREAALLLRVAAQAGDRADDVTELYGKILEISKRYQTELIAGEDEPC